MERKGLLGAIGLSQMEISRYNSRSHLSCLPSAKVLVYALTLLGDADSRILLANTNSKTGVKVQEVVSLKIRKQAKRYEHYSSCMYQEGQRARS